MPSWACACEQAVAHTVGIPGFGHPRKRKGYEKHRYRAFGLKSWNQAWNLCMLEKLGPCKSRKLCTSDDRRINLEISLPLKTKKEKLAELDGKLESVCLPETERGETSSWQCVSLFKRRL